MQRRGFLATPLAAFQLAAAPSDPPRVYATGDGVPLTPAEYAQLLTKLASDSIVDDYSRGGIVEKLEAQVAATLGQEAAVWLPTGTLANHLAVRLLAAAKRRVLVQAASHLHNDFGDSLPTL